jgi:hypothetical protein
MVLRGVPRQKEHGARFKIKDNGILYIPGIKNVLSPAHYFNLS